MTTHIQLPDVSPVTQATADGSQRVFAFPFPIFHDSDIEVRVGASTLITGFTVFGAGSSKGGAVVFASAPAAGSRVTLRRRQVYARTDDFLDERAPTPHELNDAVDEAVAAIQELAEESSRSVQRPLSADLSRAVDLSLPEPEANKVLGWNGAADGLANIAQIDPSNVLHRDQNLADLPDKAAARANLGLGSAATHAEGDFATAAQGAKADTALQPAAIGTSVQAHDADLDWLAANLSNAGRALIDDADAAAQRATLGLAAVAVSGSYTDLSNKPALGSAAALNVGTAANQIVQLDSNAKLPAVDGSQLTNIPVGEVQTDGTDAVGYLQDKLAAGSNVTVTKSAGKMVIAAPNALDKTQNLADLANAATARSNLGLASVAASGSYTDLSNKPALGSAAALNVDTDTTLATNSDALLPSQKAVKAYVGAQVATFQSDLYPDLGQLYLAVARLDTPTTPNFGGTQIADEFDGTSGIASLGSATVTNGYLSNPRGGSAIPQATGTVMGAMATGGFIASFPVTNAFDGNNATYAEGNALTAWTAIGKDYGSGYRIFKADVIPRSDVGFSDYGAVPVTLKLYGSNTAFASGGTLLATSAFTNVTTMQTLTSGDSSTAYRYVWVEIGVTGANMCSEIIFYQTIDSADITTVSTAYAAQSSPSAVSFVAEYQDIIGSSTVNTDITFEASRDGGTSWTAVSMADFGPSLVPGARVLKGSASVSGQPGGTAMKWRIKTLNAREQRVHGLWMQWK